MNDQEKHNPELSITPDQGMHVSVSNFLTKYCGLQIFQKYCIPNSTATRNPLFSHLKILGKQPLYSLDDVSGVSLEDRLKKRVLGCYLFGIWHFMALLANVYCLFDAKSTLAKGVSILWLVMNTYLVANQIEIRSRIKRVMQQRDIV